jgi:diguanylate cyclase (GGDEF)-like protein
MTGPVLADELEQARAAFRAYRYDEARSSAELLYRRAGELGYATGAGQMALLLAKVHANQGRHDEAGTWAQRAADEGSSEPGHQAQAWVLLASECARDDRPAPAMRAVGRVLALLPALQAPAELSVVFTGLAFTYLALSMPGQALDAAQRALDAALTLGDDTQQVRCVVNLVGAGLEAWDLLPEAERPGRGLQLLAELRAHCLWLRQRWLNLPRPEESGRASWVELLSRVQVRAGEWAAARELLQEQLTRQWHGNPAMERDLWIDLARVQQAEGDAAAAQASAERAATVHARVARPARAAELPLLSTMAELRGHAAEALALAREHHRRTQSLVLGALQARVDELSTQLTAQTLRRENAALKSRNEGLAASVQQISQLAATDALTGLPNRRGLEALWAQADGPGAAAGSWALAMLDVDHFKAINDTHSHAVGDAVLREVAQVMAHALRLPDRLARWGGEEFVALLSGLSHEAAAAVLERLRERVQAHDWQRLAPGLQVTLSAGLTSARPGESLATVMARADALLYQAKGAGRNRVGWQPEH